MKKILYDLSMTQPLDGVKYHGGGRYGEIVFEHLIKKSELIDAVYDGKRWLNPLVREKIDLCHIELFDLQKMTLEQLMQSGKYILYTPIVANNHRVLSKKYEVLGTIHGLRMYEMPGDKFQLKYTFPKSLKNWIWTLWGIFSPETMKKWARHRAQQNFASSNLKIVTVSNHSKYSILSAVPSIKADDINVFYSPSTVVECGQKLTTNGLPAKFFLMVSGDRWLKNCYRAVRAFDELFSERPNLDFCVVVTGLGSKVRYRKYIKNPNRFVFFDYTDDALLQHLYTSAYAFVYPTLNEGFGYPPVEAMHCGTPVISSAIAAVTEICQDSVLYFNPYSIQEIKMRILQMCDSSVYKDFKRRAVMQYRMVSERQQRDLDGLCDYLLSFLKER